MTVLHLMSDMYELYHIIHCIGHDKIQFEKLLAKLQTKPTPGEKLSTLIRVCNHVGLQNTINDYVVLICKSVSLAKMLPPLNKLVSFLIRDVVKNYDCTFVSITN